jgi:hypothetical protein
MTSAAVRSGLLPSGAWRARLAASSTGRTFALVYLSICSKNRSRAASKLPRRSITGPVDRPGDFPLISR